MCLAFCLQDSEMISSFGLFDIIANYCNSLGYSCDLIITSHSHLCTLFLLLECSLSEVSLYSYSIQVMSILTGFSLSLQLQLKDWNLMLGVATLIAIDLTILVTYTVVEKVRRNLAAKEVMHGVSIEGVSLSGT